MVRRREYTLLHAQWAQKSSCQGSSLVYFQGQSRPLGEGWLVGLQARDVNFELPHDEKTKH